MASNDVKASPGVQVKTVVNVRPNRESVSSALTRLNKVSANNSTVDPDADSLVTVG